jgi:hypothetical protein
MLHPNFYENLEEMQRRLYDTVVTYDGEPVRVIAITNHRADGIFRLYLWPVQDSVNEAAKNGKFPLAVSQYPGQDQRLGPALDKWMEENKDTKLLRKQANSPAFNKFRPFSLGMMNRNGRALFLERSPERRTQQGLIRQMVECNPVTTDRSRVGNNSLDSLVGPEFYDCVKGNHPSAEECMENMLDPNVENTSVACHRNFAIVRGPMDTFFLGYKTDVVGIVPPTKRPTVELGKKFAHLKEAVEETRQFHDIKLRQ